MKIKHLLSLAIAILMIAFISCNDELDNIGGNIQPDGDDISVYIDTVVLTARTVSMEDSVYARSNFGLLGEYTDPIFGKIKSDFLSELFCSEKTAFHEKTISVDSVFLDIVSEISYGDSISPIGITAYRVDKKDLNRDFYTNVKPTDYCSMKQIIGQGVFTIKDAEHFGSNQAAKQYRLLVNKSLGNEIYNNWKKSNGNIFANEDSLRNYFKGIYITSNFGSGSLINVNTSRLLIYYSYTGRNSGNTADSVRVGSVLLPTNQQVIQLNRVQNTIPSYLLENGDSKVYLKSPAGVCTEITIPLKQIIEKAKRNNKINIVNSASFNLKGFTEEEQNMTLGQSSNLLFINKDSINNFFSKNKNADNNSSFIMIRSAATNTYNFSNSNQVSSLSNNLATMVNYYVNYYKDKETVPDLKFLVLPISTAISYVSANYTQVAIYSSVYNQMTPTSAILRSDKDNMKMGLIFSDYNSN